MKTVLLFMMCLVSALTVRATEYILEGTIGKYPVVMKLRMDKDWASARYFYRSSFRDIELAGLPTRDGVSLVTEDSTEKLLLHLQPDKVSWAGIWSNDKGRQYQVTLKPVNLNAIVHPFGHLEVVKGFKTKDKYEYVRSSMMPIIKDSVVVKKGNYSLQYFHLKNTGITMFTIVAGLPEQVSEKVNKLLMESLISNACNYCACLGYGNKVFREYSISSIFLTDNVLSIDIAQGWDCRGQAHPEEGDEYINIDLKTGKKLGLTDVLYFSGVKKGAEEVYMNKVYYLLRKLHPKEMADTTADCSFLPVEPWIYAQWNIIDKGLYISPSFPHAVLQCRKPDWSYIPFDVLKKYKNPAKSIILP